MSHIFDLIRPSEMERLLADYCSALGSPLLLLGENGQILLRCPPDAPESGTVRKEVRVRDRLVCHVAMPASASRGLDFVAANLAVISERGYEIESLAGEVARNYEELSLLWKLSSELGTAMDVEEICRILIDEVMNVCPSKNVSVLLLSESGKHPTGPETDAREAPGRKQTKKFFFPKICAGTDADRSSMMVFSTDRGLLGHVFETKEPLTICDVGRDERFEGFPYFVHRILIVPLIVEHSVIGAVIATDKLDGEEYYATEIKLLSGIASECAVSIKKALLFEEIRAMLFSISESFSLAIDAKDSYTYGHSKRVCEMATTLARAAGLPTESVRWIKLAALLHDIGKIGTPEDILHKDGLLSDEEMDRIKEHPVTGAKMLEHIQRMREISLWIMHHHEKYDGSGYPSGLKGEEIPFPSRIIKVADCFDALTTNRPYRTAFTKEEAVHIMKDGAGTDFDPVVFGHFLRIFT